jgi:hypothetical protein
MIKSLLTPLPSLPPWPLGRKLVFRFALLFFGLNIFPFPLNALPFLDGFFFDVIDEHFWNPLVQACGRWFFGLPEITVRPNGSGDTTWNWLQQFAIVGLATLGSLLWAWLDRRRPSYHQLGHWFAVWLRYYLVFTMFTYGFVKIFPLQFGNLTTYRLYERLGEMSPMGLLWTFMAYSPGYQFFSGACEVLAGLLLLFRRTQTLGALVTVGVMGNVFMLNVFYDVPVKIYSFWLMLGGAYLASLDGARLWNVLVANRATAPVPTRPFVPSRALAWGAILLKAAFVLGLAGPMLYQDWQRAQYGEAPKGAFYGPYRAEKFERSPAVADADTLAWEEVFVDRRGAYDLVYVVNQHGLRRRFNLERNLAARTLRLRDPSATDTTSHPFAWHQPDSASLSLVGKLGPDSLRVHLRKMPNRAFLLPTRGFHWINEFPLNK